MLVCRSFGDNERSMLSELMRLLVRFASVHRALLEQVYQKLASDDGRLKQVHAMAEEGP